MREIKFKAKRIRGNYFVYGYYWYNDFTKEHFLKCLTEGGTQYEDIKIIPETICQFTGFKDVEGNDAYENDTIEKNEHIIYREGCFFSGSIPLALVIEHRKIIGNIHD
jgi:hypothetical protein